ncbi:hypothetical protein BpHYR1_011827 [Brachionus plicatilis]|uniref:Uncharacterized protein n=1 Tax=Brachionus plicatilis TaxID=10195 RepID=A0A3M7RWC4_BRAPC|nr:hypothetical protein BpHYR1_011827 [Brachionus plicatilis]
MQMHFLVVSDHEAFNKLQLLTVSNRLFELSERYVAGGLGHSVPLVVKLSFSSAQLKLLQFLTIEHLKDIKLFKIEKLYCTCEKRFLPMAINGCPKFY